MHAPRQKRARAGTAATGLQRTKRTSTRRRTAGACFAGQYGSLCLPGALTACAFPMRGIRLGSTSWC
jgi:hypothetical protein